MEKSDQDKMVEQALASCFRCEHMRCVMSRATCVRNQIGKPVRTRESGARLIRSPPPPHCRSGQCRQGLEILIEDGLVKKSTCPTCNGCGWIATETE